MRYDVHLEQFVPDAMPAGTFAAGRMNGIYDLDARRHDGEAAGHEAAAFIGRTRKSTPRPRMDDKPRSHPWPVVAHPKHKDFVDLDEDLQFKDFLHAIQEGFDHPELLKRYSTVGMGPSQANIPICSPCEF